jgi:hypothetical protein
MTKASGNGASETTTSALSIAKSKDGHPLHYSKN